jgi:acetoin utilization deacetylase AcuC-like enzyme
MSVGVFYHPDFAEKGYITLLHRVKPAYDTLCRQPYAVKLKFFEPSVTTLHQRLLNQVHTESHIGTVQAEGFHEVAILSAAGVVTAAELLAAQQLDSAFCFVGTAGHHAGRNYSWGFCYYNDVAMAVVRLRQLGVNRILILDMDPHSGDGTRDILALDPQITHINFFADEDYSYQDDKHHNYGILIDNATDKVFLEALEEILPKAANVDFVIVIFGHDSHCEDYGDFYLTINGYREFTHRMKEFAANRPLLFVLSGGSNPQVAASAIPTVIESLLD